ncbi:hypothetical protein GCM10023185_02150 [Hymenobacter saemangeumensis]|uniref:Secreted protein n=1 Tax=Hymenobacter saemangeumensis TaxID=1084522 RepID=A0ABP8HY04_9BACT
MKKMLVLPLALGTALGLASACSRDVTSEARASSPSAAEFNRQTANSTKTDEEIAADSIRDARRAQRTVSQEEPR